MDEYMFHISTVLALVEEDNIYQHKIYAFSYALVIVLI